MWRSQDACIANGRTVYLTPGSLYQRLCICLEGYVYVPSFSRPLWCSSRQSAQHFLLPAPASRDALFPLTRLQTCKHVLPGSQRASLVIYPNGQTLHRKFLPSVSKPITSWSSGTWSKFSLNPNPKPLNYRRTEKTQGLHTHGESTQAHKSIFKCCANWQIGYHCPRQRKWER